jgi:hypothetical protein
MQISWLKKIQISSTYMGLKIMNFHLKNKEQAILISKNRFLEDLSHLEPHNPLKTSLLNQHLRTLNPIRELRIKEMDDLGTQMNP